jgi:hypothetical protein
VQPARSQRNPEARGDLLENVLLGDLLFRGSTADARHGHATKLALARVSRLVRSDGSSGSCRSPFAAQHGEHP